MAKIAEVQEVAVDLLIPYEQNAKIHGAEQIEKIKASIEEFGFLTPCLVDRDYNIIAGHGRVMAARELGLDAVPCVFIEGLSEAQRRAYILADNRLGELGAWEWGIVFDELAELGDLNFDVELTGFELPQDDSWFEDRERNDTSKQEGNDEYNEFLEKFEAKKTTDDCYTPDLVYDAVADWVAETYNLDRENFVRPFYPNGDYKKYKYGGRSVVVDNPPFSILSEILDFYNEHGIQYFLFAPALTMYSTSVTRACAICVGAIVTYENGATVNTSFVTSLEDWRTVTAPDLYQRIKEANDENLKQIKTEQPKYSYPNEVLTSAKMNYISKHGGELKVSKEDSERISALDSQREKGAAIFGGGLLLSEKAAAEKAAAEKAAAEKAAAEKAAAEKAAAEKAAATRWPLSDRELEIVRSLGKGNE